MSALAGRGSAAIGNLTSLLEHQITPNTFYMEDDNPVPESPAAAAYALQVKSFIYSNRKFCNVFVFIGRQLCCSLMVALLGYFLQCQGVSGCNGHRQCFIDSELNEVFLCLL